MTLSHPMGPPRWRPVVGFELAYAVSEWGHIWSIPRVVQRCTGEMRVAGRLLAQTPNGVGGYIQVGLQHGTRRVKTRAHVVVAEAFLGTRPDGQYVAHNDGDPSNNCLSNLRYATPEQNQADRTAHGTDNRGVRHHGARLTPSLVQYIDRQRLLGRSYRSIGRELGVSWGTVRNAWKRRRWSHVPRLIPRRSP